MEMRKCVNGHYYDASVNSECPYCKSGTNAGRTVSLGAAQGSGAGGSMMDGDGSSKTIPMGYGAQPQFTGSASAAVDDDGDSKTMPMGYSGHASSGMQSSPVFSKGDDDGRTIAVVHQDMGIDPVVGWLVCVSGKEKGRDYRIHSDNNYIGRSEKMDICVRGDETISRENHAVVSYDTIDKIYYFSPGDGRNIVRHNGKAIFQTVELNAYDRVIVGKTELIFMPLCGKDFEWSNEDAAI